MHTIQEHILRALTLEEEMRYAKLKPKRIESNLFSYHLHELVRLGYVKKKDGAYSLTGRGKRYAEVGFRAYHPQFQPKIVTLVICEDSRSKYLLYQRKQEPLYDYWAFPYGRVHLGERIHEAAERELKEKTGVSAKLSHRGEAYITIHEKDELISHMLCHVFVGKNPKGTLTPHGAIESLEWLERKTVISKKLVPGFLEIFQKLEKESHFFLEIRR